MELNGALQFLMSICMALFIVVVAANNLHSSLGPRYYDPRRMAQLILLVMLMSTGNSILIHLGQCACITMWYAIIIGVVSLLRGMSTSLPIEAACVTAALIQFGVFLWSSYIELRHHWMMKQRLLFAQALFVIGMAYTFTWWLMWSWQDRDEVPNEVLEHLPVYIRLHSCPSYSLYVVADDGLCSGISNVMVGITSRFTMDSC
jgi:hypothetical protein